MNSGDRQPTSPAEKSDLARDQRFSAPDKETIENGPKYYCAIDRDNRTKSGKIYDEQNNVLWTYHFGSKRSGFSRGNPFGKPDFVLSNAKGDVESVIRRVSFLSSQFEIRDQQGVVGRLKARRPFRITYDIEISPSSSWTFVMRLFKVHFLGYSQTQSDFWVMVGPSKMEWIILIRPGIQPRHLVASLAFIHNEWWNFG